MEDDSTSLAIVRAPEASQKVFSVNADNPIDIRSGTVIIGSSETGALDSVIGEIRLKGGATLNTYVKKIGDGGKSKNISVAGVFNFRVAEISEDGALLSFRAAVPHRAEL